LPRDLLSLALKKFLVLLKTLEDYLNIEVLRPKNVGVGEDKFELWATQS